MDVAPQPREHHGEPAAPDTAREQPRRGPLRLVSRTLWKDRKSVV